MSYAQALALADDLRELFAAHPVEDRPVVTLDPTEAGRQLAAGGTAVMIGPPVTRYPNYRHAEHEWTLAAVAGPLTDRAESWHRLDGLVQRLLNADRDVTRVDPGSFTADRAQAEYSALLISLTTESTI